MKIKRLLITGFLMGLGLFLTVSPSAASEGTIEMKSTVDQPTGCFILSVKTSHNQYSLLGTCRYLIYPPDDQNLYYVLWAKPLEEDKRMNRLTKLDYGKFNTTSRSAFSELIVTKEKSTFISAPSEEIVLKGTVQPVPLAESDQLITSQSENNQVTPSQDVETMEEAIFPEVSSQKGLSSTIFIVVAGLTALGFLLFIVLRR
jgi:hypothetical protein